MNRQRIRIALGLTLVVGAFLTVAAIRALGQPGNTDKLIIGETAVVAGSQVSTWARVNGAGEVTSVGLTLPLSLVENMPPEGAIAKLNYPAVVQATTYFHHAEVHSEPQGHPTNPEYVDTNRYGAAHYDLHFYNIPDSQIAGIPFGFFFDQAAADQVPKFYAQPEAISIPQMGRHCAPTSEFTATDHWLATMLAGFLPDASYMHFLEPMATRELLLQRKSFIMQVPRPSVLGRETLYPAEFLALYDKDTDAYQFVFVGFRTIR